MSVVKRERTDTVRQYVVTRTEDTDGSKAAPFVIRMGRYPSEDDSPTVPGAFFIEFEMARVDDFQQARNALTYDFPNEYLDMMAYRTNGNLDHMTNLIEFRVKNSRRAYEALNAFMHDALDKIKRTDLISYDDAMTIINHEKEFLPPAYGAGEGKSP
jgi:hypothetical protein